MLVVMGQACCISNDIVVSDLHYVGELRSSQGDLSNTLPSEFEQQCLADDG